MMFSTGWSRWPFGGKRGEADLKVGASQREGERKEILLHARSQEEAVLSQVMPTEVLDSDQASVSTLTSDSQYSLPPFSVFTKQVVLELLQQCQQSQKESAVLMGEQSTRAAGTCVATAAAQYSKMCFDKAESAVSEVEKNAWEELAYCKYQEAQAQIARKEGTIKKYRRTASVLEKALRELHYSNHGAPVKEQAVIAQGGMEAAEREENDPGVKNVSSPQELTLLAQESFLNNEEAELQMGEQHEQEEESGEEALRSNRIAISAKKAVEYRQLAVQAKSAPEKRALEKAIENSLLEQEALLAGNEDYANHFLRASTYAADAAFYFQKGRECYDQEKQRKYFSKGSYYIELAELWKQHQAREAEDFTCEKFWERERRAFLLRPITPQNIPCHRPL